MRSNFSRIGFVYFAFIAVALCAIGKMVHLQFFDPLRKADHPMTKDTEKVVETEATRGSILAADGRYLAFSIPEYYIAMDCTVVDSAYFYDNVAALSKCLADTYKERSASEYESLLKSCRAGRGRKYIRLLKQHVSYEEMKAISKYPILERGQARGGLIVEQIDHREYPSGNLAFRTLGHLTTYTEIPKVGIEASMDSVLRGIPGTTPMRLIEHNEWIVDVEKELIPPVNGMDVQISIDVNIQDIAQKALLSKINGEEDLEAGCAIVMDVHTGEIKAMVNMEKSASGNFTETYNYAIGRRGEPGSVFKLATLVTAVEDGKVTLETTQPADVFWKYYKVKQPFEDTYLKNYTTITVKKGFEISSNNVFRRIAGECYDSDPQGFVDKLKNDRKITYNYEFDIPGLAKATIREPSDRYWSPADLPQIGMGYAVELTPLHILSFYNAIANNGIMVKPHLLVNLQRNGVVEKTYPVEEIGRVCSEKTVQTVREALRGVVIGENGTARTAFRNCKVAVAGKTGTARIALPGGGYVDASGRKKHQGSFVGFFPYEDPKYSVIVVVYSRLANKNFYGGTWGGPVACEIADNIYASSPDWNEATVVNGAMPEIIAYRNESVNDTILGVPDVLGMGMREAIYTIESAGYKVKARGEGWVISQTPAAGDLMDEENKTVEIVLSEKVQRYETGEDSKRD
ncbi:MAG: transpeptidase family protein [Bacteroidales bacterium]|nr:transpeptidase family protein [Bacteroidales bacterium]